MEQKTAKREDGWHSVVTIKGKIRGEAVAPTKQEAEIGALMQAAIKGGARVY